MFKFLKIKDIDYVLWQVWLLHSTKTPMADLVESVSLLNSEF